MARRTLIVGCGYVGLPLARELQSRGDEVTAWVRSGDSAAQLIDERFARVITGSVADEECWRRIGAFEAVVHCASSGGGGVVAYREVYLEGARQMNTHQPDARRVLVSSTSVYGQTDGEVVDESAETAPTPETSQVLVETERAAMNAGAIVVRAAGIYGPGRAALFEKFRRGEAVMDGEGSRWINQVHRDDLVAAIIRLLETGVPGEVYNAADHEPVMLRAYYAWCSDKLGKPMPPPGAVDPNRKRGLTNKRISNRKLHAIGWTPHFPSFREGLADRFE